MPSPCSMTKRRDARPSRHIHTAPLGRSQPGVLLLEIKSRGPSSCLLGRLRGRPVPPPLHADPEAVGALQGTGRAVAPGWLGDPLLLQERTFHGLTCCFSTEGPEKRTVFLESRRVSQKEGPGAQAVGVNNKAVCPSLEARCYPGII